MASPSVHSFECRDVLLSKVVVYTDRAELTRLVKVTLEPGLNEVLLQNVPESFIRDSVRVNGRGEATIHEVQFREKPSTRAEADSPKVKEITEKLEAKEKEKLLLEDQKKVTDKRIEVLDQVIAQVGNTGVRQPPSESNGQVQLKLDNESLSQLENFFQFYQRNSVQVRKEAHDVEESLKTVNEEIQKLQRQRNELTHFRGYTREFTVLLETEKGGEMELDVIYQVYGASWSPRYDIRVETGDKKSLKVHLSLDVRVREQVTYSGVVCQSTGEDWKDAHLVLSTAQPALGGQIPKLGTLEASLFRPPPPPPQPMRTALFGMAPGASAGGGGEGFAFGATNALAQSAAAPRMMRKAMEVASADVSAPVSEHTLATEFDIKRAATIPGDNSEHRVSIGVVETEPRLLHECVPGKNSSAFLTASALNSSGLAFLAGPAAVYLDGSFIAHTQLAEVSPGERFSCSLGVDTAVRIDYRPAHKFREQVGIINKAASVIHEQRIVVKNSRSSGEPLLLSIHEHLPKSTDDKIKIRLLNPADARPVEKESEGETLPSPGAIIDKNNNLVVTIKVEPKQQVDLLVKWSLEHPNNEKIEYRERF